MVFLNTDIAQYDLTIIMCSYNEAGRIEAAVDDLYASAMERSETFEVIALDNGSTDGTKEWLKAAEYPNFKKIFNEVNLGKGGSIKSGIAMSKGKYVVIHDPDMEYKACDIWRLLDAAIQDDVQMVLGSRTLGQGKPSYHYIANYLGVRFLTALINILFGSKLTDTATAMKLIDGNVGRSMRFQSTGFDLDFELVVRIRRLGYLISERRIDYFPRTKAEGKKIRAWRDGLLSMKAILRDRILSKDKFILSQISSDNW